MFVQLLQYEEMFSSALDGYNRAAALDPGWEEPLEREKLLLNYLDQITTLQENKVKEVTAECFDTSRELLNI